MKILIWERERGRYFGQSVVHSQHRADHRSYDRYPLLGVSLGAGTMALFVRVLVVPQRQGSVDMRGDSSVVLVFVEKVPDQRGNFDLPLGCCTAPVFAVDNCSPALDGIAEFGVQSAKRVKQALFRSVGLLDCCLTCSHSIACPLRIPLDVRGQVGPRIGTSRDSFFLFQAQLVLDDQ